MSTIVVVGEGFGEHAWLASAQRRAGSPDEEILRCAQDDRQDIAQGVYPERSEGLTGSLLSKCLGSECCDYFLLTSRVSVMINAPRFA
jgi:hypothetical protein